MWSRTRLVEVPAHVPAIDLLGRLSEFDVVVMDIDDTLVPTGATRSVMVASVEKAREAAGQHGIGRLVMGSNGHRSRAVAGTEVMWQLNKPWTRAVRLGIARRDVVAVVGDRVFADGLLARRLGADFYRISAIRGPRIRRSGLIGSVGRMATRALFEITDLD